MMKPELTLLLIFFIYGLSGCQQNMNPAGKASLQGQSWLKNTNFNLPVDFIPQPSDWIDQQRPKAGWPLGMISLRGKGLKECNGVYPIHLMRVNLPQAMGNLLQKDDLILAVGGTPLGPNPENQFMSEFKRSEKKGTPLSLTRWRKGNIKPLSLDLSFTKKENSIPDLTRGEKPDGTHDWNLGPIGAQGWGFSKRSEYGASYEARQLLITLVDEKGPSHGILKVGDVIVGTNEKDFSSDARRVLAQAINETEKFENEGKLNLKIWREGVRLSINIQIKTLGTYSPTAPFECPKTEKIIDQAVEHLKKDPSSLGKKGAWAVHLNGLGLLSTGRKDVLPLVRKLAHNSLLKDDQKLSIEKRGHMVSWGWAYKTIFLAEYYLVTKDTKVLPTLDEYATKIAMGQSGVGTWGHGYAPIESSGGLHGPLTGYGALNQTGLALTMGLILAKKCGIENKEIDDAIQRGKDFFTFFIGRGTIPYGDHGALPWYDDNGKSGAAAVLFDFWEHQSGREFFSEMVLGSAPSGREKGHCGHYWSHLWGGLGAARGGDKALQAYMDKMNPIFTLERNHNGGFYFQGNVGEKGHQGKAKHWETTGARLLQLCYPRRALYITGKATPSQSHLTEARIQSVFKAGELFVHEKERKKLTKEDLLQLLESPLPPTRATAVKELESRELNCVEELLSMLQSNNPHARHGAAEALGRVGFGNKKAAQRLIALMPDDPDMIFRSYAVKAMNSSDPQLGLITQSKAAIPVLLKMAVSSIEEEPRGVLQGHLAQVLFRNMRGEKTLGLIPYHGIEDHDRPLLVAAVKAILKNRNGATRSVMSHTAYPLLTKKECEDIWGDIYRASRFISPSGIMFATGVRKDGVKLMGQHHIKEGLELASWYLRHQKGFGKGNGITEALGAIESYGSHAKVFIPYLEEHIEHFGGTPPLKEGRRPRAGGVAYKTRETISRIQASTQTPELTSIEGQLEKKDYPIRGQSY